LFIIIISVALNLTSCGRDSYSDITRRWLAGTSCQSPCWEGITLEQTKKSEAISILKQNPYVSQIKEGKDSADWEWSDGKFGGGQFVILDDKGVVGMLLVDLPEPVYLGDVIDAYGEPSHIIARKIHDSWHDDTYYPLLIMFESQGFTLDTGFHDNEPRLDRKLTFYKVVYPMYPRYKGMETMVPWEGFKSFRFYCRDKFGDFCK